MLFTVSLCTACECNMYIIINYYSHTACGLFLLMLLYSPSKGGKKFTRNQREKDWRSGRERERDDIYWHFYFPNQLGFSLFFHFYCTCCVPVSCCMRRVRHTKQTPYKIRTMPCMEAAQHWSEWKVSCETESGRESRYLYRYVAWIKKKAEYAICAVNDRRNLLHDPLWMLVVQSIAHSKHVSRSYVVRRSPSPLPCFFFLTFYGGKNLCTPHKAEPSPFSTCDRQIRKR